MTPLALRMDDVGASSKRYEVYSKWRVGAGPLQISGNWLFLKYLRPFKAWGPYPELEANQWRQICDLLIRHEAKLTVAITAGWAESSRRVIPFPERFPAAAAAIKEGVAAGLLEVANHGWTHCVLAGDQFKPRWFTSNREFHREFWDWVPADEQARHLRESQQILQSYFEVPVVTFVPPGNVFGERTVTAAAGVGLRYLSCETTPRQHDGMVVIGNRDVVAFHDRDLVLHGVEWLQRRLEEHRGRRFSFVRELVVATTAVTALRGGVA